MIWTHTPIVTCFANNFLDGNGIISHMFWKKNPSYRSICLESKGVRIKDLILERVHVNKKTFFGKAKINIFDFRNLNYMAHHTEPEENEIGGPVLFALGLFAIVIIIIYFWAA